MFANQAASSAILVVTLHQHGTSAERAVDAIIGGGVAFVLGVLVFPVRPVALMRNAESNVLESLAESLDQASGLLTSRTRPEAGWIAERSLHAHQQLDILSRARVTAQRVAEFAPRRWSQRAAVASEVRRATRLDGLADVVLSLTRVVTTGLGTEGLPPSPLERRIALLETTIRALATTPRPWPDNLVEEWTTTDPAMTSTATSDHAHAVRGLLHAVAVDLVVLVRGDPEGAEER